VLLPDSRNAVLFVGYQAEGTKGWFLEHQGKTEGSIRIHHVPVPVNAQIDSIDSLSAHGDTDDLVAWVKSGNRLPKKVILNHGTPESARALALRIETELKIKAVPVR
jgi:metallo-beta-lactamase family protein